MGTLLKLKEPISITGVPLDPADNMKGGKDFLLVLHYCKLLRLL